MVVKLLRLASFFIFGSVASCSTSEDTDGVTGLELIVARPIVPKSGEVVYMSDTSYIYQYKSYVIYSTPEHYIKHDFFDHEIIGEEIVHRLHFFKRGDSLCRVYATYKDVEHRLPDSPVDSVERNVLTKVDFSLVRDSMELAYKEERGDQLEETYSIENVYGPGMLDTVFLGFDRKSDISGFSLGERIEATRGGKLYSVRMKFNGGTDPDGINYPAREYSYRLSSLKSVPPEISGFFQVVEKEYEGYERRKGFSSKKL